MPTPFKLLEGDTLPLDAEPGSAIFLKDIHGSTTLMQFACPCGCGKAGTIKVRKPGSPDLGSPQWTMSGHPTSPTLRPSVHNTGFPCRWHGWLTNGIWRRVGEGP